METASPPRVIACQGSACFLSAARTGMAPFRETDVARASGRESDDKYMSTV